MKMNAPSCSALAQNGLNRGAASSSPFTLAPKRHTAHPVPAKKNASSKLLGGQLGMLQRDGRQQATEPCSTISRLAERGEAFVLEIFDQADG